MNESEREKEKIILNSTVQDAMEWLIGKDFN
jgi:hypothetical protein